MLGIVHDQRLPSSLCSVAVAGALCIAPIACDDGAKDKTEGKASGAAKTAEAGDDGKAAGDDAGKAGDDAGKAGGDGNGDGGIADVAKTMAGVVSGPRDIEPSYAKELDPLLDLIPADSDSFIVIRDVGAFVEGTLGYLEASKISLGKLADEVEKQDPGDAKELRENLKKVVEFEKALTASGIDLSAGAVIAGKRGDDDHDFVLYGSAKVDALPTLLTTVGATGSVPKDCTAVASAAGYAVCAKADVKTYAPGSKAATFRAMIEKELPGVDLDRANIVAHFVDRDGKNIPIAVETGQGMAHVSFAVPQTRDDLAKYLKAGKGAGLGLIGPGQPFVWAQGNKKEIENAEKTAPKMAQNMVKTLTGEVLAGGIDGAKGFAMLVGLTDPAPVAGLVALAGMGLGEVPEELPDGTKIDATVKTVRGAQALHVKFEGGEQAKFFDAMGYVSEVFGFAAGQYAAVTFGATDEVVETIAAYKGTGPSEELLGALPTPLAKAVKAGEPAFAMYVPFDAIQAAKTAKVFDSLAAAVPPGEFGPTDAKDVMGVFVDAMAPLSSASMWVSHLDEGPVFHMAVQGFAEAGTEEGKAALDAISAVAGGADREKTYAALAGKYPSSARAASYKARAGSLGDPFASVFVVAGMAGAVGGLFFLGRDTSSTIAVEAPPTPTKAAPAPELPTTKLPTTKAPTK